MDDLLGEDWQSSSSKQPPLQPYSSTTLTSSYNAARTIPQPSISGSSSAFNLSRPSSTKPIATAKSPFNVPKPSTDAFGSLTGLKSQKTETLSIQERQRKLEEERQKRLQEEGQLWNNLGVVAKSNGTTVHKSMDDEDDILAAFNKDAKVDKSSHFPPPTSEPTSRGGTPANGLQQQFEGFEDDDTFGLNRLPPKSDGHAVVSVPDASTEEDDILGDLSRPVVPKSVPTRSPSPDIGWDENIAAERKSGTTGSQHPSLAELVEMGFPEDTAMIALAENGGDVQRAVGWLLRQAHEESKQQMQEQRSGQRSPVRAGRSPPRRARGDDGAPSWMKESRSSSSSQQRGKSEKDASQVAQDLGSKLFKSANSLWKASQKQMAKTVAEFQQERDPSQPKWMQSAGSSRDASQSRQQRAAAIKVTNEAALLDMPRDVPQQSLPERSAMNGRSAVPPQSSSNSQNSGRASPQVSQDRRPASKLSGQDVEEQTAQAYISPARRKQKPKPEVIPEPEVDLFSPAPSHSAAATVQVSKPAPASRPRVEVPTRSIPTVTPSALASSAQARTLGTQAFKRGDYGVAHEAYTAALQPLPSMHPLVIVVLSNRSLTALKTGDAKTAVSDADRALDVIGPGLGAGEMIDVGGSDGPKEMREFYGKALMRKAEALEHMEKWTEAGNVWRLAVEGGVGGAISLRGKDRCEKAATPAPARPKASTTPAAAARSVKAAPAKSLGNSIARPTLTTPSSDAAVKKLREANAAAERADDEKFQLADKVDAQLVAWKGGKADNLRALLQSLDVVLWESAGWKKVGMSDLVMPNKVKIIYMKAIAKVHPDKISQDANTEQRMISAAVFSTLNEAWEKFKKDNNL